MKVFQLLATPVALVRMMVGTQAWAGEWKSFDSAAFKQAQGEGKTVVLDFHADWCSTCQKQKPILESLLKEAPLQKVIGFKVDYDHADALKKELKVRRQSTLVVYRGENEVARQIGLTDQDEIRTLISKGI